VTGRVLSPALFAVLLGAGACGPPIRASRVDAHRVHRHLTSNVLSSGELSRPTRNVLYNRDLRERYDADPAAALAAAHAALVAGQLQPDETAALAELAFRHAEHGGGRPYFLAAAIYAWAYLFPEGSGAGPDPFDPRLRLACDIYNRGLTEGFEAEGDDRVDLRAGTFALPFGALDVTFAPDALRWGGYVLSDLVPVAELEVEGFPTLYRWPGLGAPLAAAVKPIDGTPGGALLAPRARVPLTAVLRIERLREQLASGRVGASLEIYPGYGEEAVTITGRRVPLEAEPTAALGFALTGSEVWKTEMRGFLRGFGIVKKENRLAAIRPYQPGLMPVVFVHGTGSSAGRWATLYNELDNDPRIHARYQFWFFSYETGNPIIYSAMLLREALEGAVAQLDPEGRDPALRRMVVIGHSQGGLLTRTMVTESGNRFWENVSKRPFEEVRLSEKTRDLLRKTLFFHPLPFVERVVFVATPHHGSYVAGSWLAHQVARLVRFPLDVTNVLSDFALWGPDMLAIQRLRGMPTAVDNMTPGNPFVKALAQLPIAPGVAAHSIIAATDQTNLAVAGDGVVKYESAHIDGVESELVVHSGHSCQENPHTIAEVRRILLLQAETARDGAGGAAANR
jgi:pimeloyl-ACP methyl ester carboxylesterase